MRILITGTAQGMGHEIAMKFLKEGHEVIGIDVRDPNPLLEQQEYYHHYIADISDKDHLPDIEGVEILVNNAGVQDTGHDIDINLKGLMYCTEKYGLQPCIRSILNQASVSAHNGAEFAEYTASKGGVLAYTKWCAKAVARYGATCNSLSFGGVTTALNSPVMNDPDLWDKIMMMTPLRKWASEREAADWVYFMTVINRSATGQDIIIDNGEILNSQFIWPGQEEVGADETY